MCEVFLPHSCTCRPRQNSFHAQRSCQTPWNVDMLGSTREQTHHLVVSSVFSLTNTFSCLKIGEFLQCVCVVHVSLSAWVMNGCGRFFVSCGTFVASESVCPTSETWTQKCDPTKSFHPPLGNINFPIDCSKAVFHAREGKIPFIAPSTPVRAFASQVPNRQTLPLRCPVFF